MTTFSAHKPTCNCEKCQLAAAHQVETQVKHGQDEKNGGVWRMDYIRKWYQDNYGDLEDVVEDGYDVCNILWYFLKQNVKPPNK